MVDTEGARLHTQLRLQRAGVSAVAADELIEAALSDPLLVLVIAPLPDGARVGDRINMKMAADSKGTLRIEAMARGAGGKCAIVGLPVEPGIGDEARIVSPVVRRTA